MDIKRKTQKKGDLALTKAIFDFTKLEYDVSLPITESAPYDLIVDDGKGLWKVQAKYLGEDVKGVDMRKIHSNSKGYVVKRYSEKDYDWLYVYKNNVASYVARRHITTQEYRPKEEDLLVKEHL